jgi:hypothetical protein
VGNVEFALEDMVDYISSLSSEIGESLEKTAAGTQVSFLYTCLTIQSRRNFVLGHTLLYPSLRDPRRRVKADELLAGMQTTNTKKDLLKWRIRQHHGVRR